MTYHEKQTLKTKYNNYKNFLMNHSYKITKTQSSINMSNENYMPQNVGVSSITISKRNSTSKILYKRTFKLWVSKELFIFYFLICILFPTNYIYFYNDLILIFLIRQKDLC